MIDEPRGRLVQRLGHEHRRSRWRLLDVLAFRLFYRVCLGRKDRDWMVNRAGRLRARFPSTRQAPIHRTQDANSRDTQAFLESVAPDITLAVCKTLLEPSIFDIPRTGTFVVHPGICPEYRNAHGCFWAHSRRDLDRVGATLLRVDAGVDTGPIYGFYSTNVDERSESNVVIQHRVVYDNLDEIKEDLERVHEGRLEPIDVSCRESAAWGQPRLSDYRRWKRRARAGAAW